MYVPFTRKTLKDWAGYKAFREGVVLFENGKVDQAFFDLPFVTGHLLLGVNGMNSKFETLANGLVDNHCPCRENRQEGRICPHLVALGLEAIRLYSDPYQIESQSNKRRRAARLARFAASAYHTRADDGSPAALRIILRQDWREELAAKSVTMRCSVELNDKVVRLNDIPKATPLALDPIDGQLLSLIEDICEGPVRKKFNVSLSDFINILELIGDKPLYESGVDEYLMVDDSITPTTVRMILDEATGELVLTLHTDSGEAFTCVVCGGKGWILQDGIFSRLESVLPGKLRDIYDSEIRIPRASIPAFMKKEFRILEKMVRAETNVTPDMLSLTPATPKLRLAIEGTPSALSAQLHAEYGIVQLVAGRNEALGRFTLPSKDGFLNFDVRNPDAEQNALNLLSEVGFKGSQGDMLIPLRGNRGILNFLANGMQKLQRMGWLIELSGTIAEFVHRSDSVVPSVHINNAKDSGFFEVDFDYRTTEGHSLSAADIQSAIECGESFIEKGGRTILLDVDAIESAQAIFNDCAVGPGSSVGSMKLNDIHAGYVQDSLHALNDIQVETAPDWLTKAESLNRTVTVEPIPLGNDLERTLRDYQKGGVNWLRFLERSGFCGILADEMGLGKTLQTLVWLQLEREQEAARNAPSLVICPTSLVDNWGEEAERFTPHLNVLRMHGAKRHAHWDHVADYDLIITSYALIRRDLEAYLNQSFSVVVLDEAQHIKNRTTQNATAVKKIRAHHRLVLTGTPIENGVSDLWSIMDFLIPGYLGSHQRFRDQYELPIRNGGADAEMAQLKLRRKLHPFLMRRLKKDVAKDLPEKIEHVAHCTLSGDQASIYKELLKAAKKEITDLVDSHGFNKSRMHVLKTLLQLRQTCCHLDLLKLPGLKSKFPSAKMELFFELVNEALDAGHRILVFSQFTSMLAIIRDALDARSLKYCYLDGSTQNR
ncbi:MAG: DEAD/DEAH box helicase family protein, partial [Verrucomicrobia bacterium]|nr:DEAD/DEAH box helicase family protein [Verrucomicrobiota bacterium]